MNELQCGCKLVFSKDGELIGMEKCPIHKPYAGSAVGVPDCDYNRRNPKSKSRKVWR